MAPRAGLPARRDLGHPAPRPHQRSPPPAQHPAGDRGRDRDASADGDLRPHGRWRHRPLYRQLLAIPRDRLRRAEPEGSRVGHGLRRLAHHLRRAGAVLHPGGAGVGSIRRRRPDGSAAQPALPAPTPAEQAGRRAGRARGAAPGLDRGTRADGHSVPTLPGAGGLRAVRILRELRLRDAGKEQHARYGDSRGGADGPLRDPPGQLRARDRGRSARPRERGRLFRRERDGAPPGGRGPSSSVPTAWRRRGSF